LLVGVFVAPLVLAAAVLRTPSLAVAPLTTPIPAPARPVSMRIVPSASPLPTVLPTATPTSAPAPTATAAPSPLPAATVAPAVLQADHAPRVGIQVGHWKSNELPDELARLRGSTGAFAAGYAEAQINLDVASRVVALLRARGVLADLLTATVPPGFEADAFVALHADGSPSDGSSGFKLGTPWRTSLASQTLLDALADQYAAATGLARCDGITYNMRGYYAFDYHRYSHAIGKTTPAVILEMGFLTSAADRELLIAQPDVAAAGIANGIISYLNRRDPADAAALLPPEFALQRPADPSGVDLRAAPRDDAAAPVRVPAARRLLPFLERDGWYQVAVIGDQDVIGWVRKDALIATDEPLPAPTDS
jgi:N-acetylmuramoyl-L-alanine amidase